MGNYTYGLAYGSPFETETTLTNYLPENVEAPLNAQVKNPGLGLNLGTLQGIGQVAQGIGGLSNAFLGYKQYGLAKDAFDFQKQAFNRNIENQGRMINNEMDRRNRVGLAMSDLSPEEKRARLNALKKNYVNTDPIK